VIEKLLASDGPNGKSCADEKLEHWITELPTLSGKLWKPTASASSYQPSRNTYIPSQNLPSPISRSLTENSERNSAPSPRCNNWREQGIYLEHPFLKH